MFRSLIIQDHFIPARIILILIIASWSKLSVYLNLDWSSNIIWIALLPFIIYIKERGVYSWKYSWLALAALVFYYFIPSPLFFFFAFCFSIFFIIEAFYGKLNRLAPLVVVLVAPLTGYLFNLFGFPIRLMLSDIAASLLNLATTNTFAQGNLISFQGQTFSVDNACMGLRMVIISFLICLLLISYFEKQQKANFKLQYVALGMVATTLLVVVSNFLRIILLILFKSAPNTLSHELIGLSCLLLCVIIPMYYLVKYLSVFSVTTNTTNPTTTTSNRDRRYLLACVISILMVFNGIRSTVYIDMPKDEVIEKMTFDGYQKVILDNNVGKFSSNDALIYVKPSKGFFRSDHSPVACWKGSGYTIQNETRQEFLGKKVYMANLVSEGSTLHTAWWYDNGAHQTIDQLDWRWRMMKGEKDFQMINITASNQQNLIKEITKFLN